MIWQQVAMGMRLGSLQLLAPFVSRYNQHKELFVAKTFAPRCLSIDIEVGKHDGRLYQVAAVRGDTGEGVTFQKGELATSFDRLDDFADGATFLLGHNLLAFDLPHLAAIKPDIRLLKLPAVDTLCLNPLAFPRNPYHHLVKHYQDAQLTRGKLNDPELDARLTLRLLSDQCDAFMALCETAPHVLTAWHWLCCSVIGLSGG